VLAGWGKTGGFMIFKLNQNTDVTAGILDALPVKGAL